jgi:hypothetical protein
MRIRTIAVTLLALCGTSTASHAQGSDARARVAARFAADARAQELALALFDADGDDVDVLPAESFDGGYRGIVSLVPALPVSGAREHLAWVAGALGDFDAFFRGLSQHTAPRYRWRRLSVLFYRSVGNTTPNAFAWDWTVAYNVHGSIDTSADAARETLFHEIFHLNDADHGDWSPEHLGPLQERIRRRCGARSACLAPYAPTSTIVRRGTYYAFQPGNDAHEYAAEVATRFYRENRALLRGERGAGPAFKCGPVENDEAWRAVRDEFFGGVDLVPACMTSPR